MYKYKELSDAIVERAVLDYKKALNRKDNSIADCTFTWYMNRNLSGLSFQLQSYVHTPSAICVVPLVLVMNFHHFFNQRFVFPGFTFSLEIIVECLSCNIKCFAIKTDFSCNSAVICLKCNKL